MTTHQAESGAAKIEMIVEALSWKIKQGTFAPTGRNGHTSLKELGRWIKEYKDAHENKEHSGLGHSAGDLSRAAKGLEGRDQGQEASIAILERVSLHLQVGNRTDAALETYLRKRTDESQITAYNEPPDTPVDVLRENFARIKSRMDSTALLGQAERAVRITTSMLRAHDLNQENAIEAAEYSESCFDLMREIPDTSSSPEAIKRAAKCARAAAWARVQAYRCMLRDDGGPGDEEDETRFELANTCLEAIEKWKRHEAEYAELEKNPVAVQFATFHADRALALRESDNHGEIRAIAALSRYLCENAMTQMTKLRSSIYYHDLTALISRLCATDWAYSKNQKYRTTLTAQFPDGIRDTIDKLMQIYAPNDERGESEKASVQALLRIKKRHDAILDTYEKDGSTTKEDKRATLRRLARRIDVYDFLRATTATNLTAIALARYAIAVADLDDPEMPLKTPIDRTTLLLAAEKACLQALERTHGRGSGGYTRVRLEFLRDLISGHLGDADRDSPTENLQSLLPALERHIRALAVLVITSGRFCTMEELNDARGKLNELSAAVDRFARDLTDPQESSSNPVDA